MKITSFALAGALGVDAVPVSIACSRDATKPNGFTIKGVSPQQSKEIATRVRSAIYSTGLLSGTYDEWPTGQVIVEIDAQGAKFQVAALDLPIACAIANVEVEGLLVAGELGLDGQLRSVRGGVQMALLAKKLVLRGVLVAAGGNEHDALEVLGDELDVRACAHLSELACGAMPSRSRVMAVRASEPRIDFAEVRGQALVVEAVASAVRQRRNLLLSGPPGSGRTMIARRIPTVLPKMTKDEQVEVSLIFSALGLSKGLTTERPFRAPHYTISALALAGGGSSPRPGEVQLATCGVLLLDEVQEFPRASIEALALALREMPEALRPLIVAAASPCPCGWHLSEGSATLGTHAARACTCRPESITRHEARIREIIEKLHLTVCVELQPASLDDLRGAPSGESSASIAARIAAPGGS